MPAAGDDVEAELGPLLGDLDAIGAEAVRIEEEARLEAERRREHGIRETATILEDARGRADAERARAASRRADGVGREAMAARAEARREVEQIRAGAEDRLTQAIAEVLECVRSSGR